MKKIKIISTTVIIFAVILAILFYNKSKLKAEATNVKIDAYPVATTKIKKETVSKPYVLVGTLQGENDVDIISETQGKVIKVSAEVGDYLNKGDVIIYVDDELQKAEFQFAEVNLMKAKSDFKRFTVLLKGKSITDSQMETSKQALMLAEANYISAKRRLDNTKIKTPISGVLTSRNYDYGHYIKKGKSVANVVNIKTLKIVTNVAEAVVFNLNVGNAVEIGTNIYPGYSFKGQIKTISEKGNASNKYPVEVILKNDKTHPLKAGMFARVVFNSSKTEYILMIPREALIGSIKNPSVYIVENRIAKLISISIGRIFDNNLEIVGGLNEGQEIIVDGQSNIKENYPVKIIKNNNDIL